MCNHKGTQSHVNNTVTKLHVMYFHTLYFTHRDFNASLASFPRIFLRVVVGQSSSIKHKPAGLPTFTQKTNTFYGVVGMSKVYKIRLELFQPRNVESSHSQGFSNWTLCKNTTKLLRDLSRRDRKCLKWSILPEYIFRDYKTQSSSSTSFTPASKHANNLTHLPNLQHVSFKFDSTHTADIVGPFIQNSLHGRQSPDNSLLSRGNTEPNRTALRNSR